IPGRVMSRIRQLGPSQRPFFKNCSAVSKLSDCRLADFSRPWIDARIRGSSSTTNTMDDSVAMRNLIVNGSSLRKWRDQLIPQATPSCLPSHEHGELTCLNVQFGVFSFVASFHGDIITARALPKLECRWNRTRCHCFCDPRRAYFR